MPTRKTSAQLLERLYEQFAANTRRNGGLLVSKREVSTIMLDSKDQALLSKWTNPGERPKWVIPLGRIPETCAQLGSTPDELDDLMLTRLSELAKTHPDHDAFAVLGWFEAFSKRAGAVIPTSDELLVLKAYRKAAEEHLLGLQGTSEEQTFLTEMFSRVLAAAEKKELKEQEALSVDDFSADAEAALERRKAEVTEMLKAAMEKKAKAEKAREEDVRRNWKKTNKGNVGRVVIQYLEDLKRRVKESKSLGQ